jgi:hypothetical protein
MREAGREKGQERQSSSSSSPCQDGSFESKPAVYIHDMKSPIQIRTAVTQIENTMRYIEIDLGKGRSSRRACSVALQWNQAIIGKAAPVKIRALAAKNLMLNSTFDARDSSAIPATMKAEEVLTQAKSVLSFARENLGSGSLPTLRRFIAEFHLIRPIARNSLSGS